jgi:ribonuclease HI
MMMRSWDALSVPANRNEVTLIWMPGHCVITGNEKLDELG